MNVMITIRISSTTICRISDVVSLVPSSPWSGSVVVRYVGI